MKPFLLVINAGSATLKFSVYQISADGELSPSAQGKIDSRNDQATFAVRLANGEVLIERKLEADVAKNHGHWPTVILNWLQDYFADCELFAIGHRIVHGGIKYSEPAIIDNEALQDLAALIPLAPLHQPYNLAFVRAFLDAMPDVPQVACFDTAFHRSQPEIAQRFALPRRYFDEGVRRYGFHGLSYEYINAKLYELEPKLCDAKTIVAHLGNGSSLCAIQHGKSIATTMGFSPLDGLVMGTRCGQIDPGVLLYLLEHAKLDVKAVEHLLYYESGLLGVSGLSSDMRELLVSDNPNAKEAIDLYVYRIVREIGSLTAAFGGLDVLVFTGGIGENAAAIRSQVCKQIAWLGLELNDAENAPNAGCISVRNSNISAWIIKTDENLMIALHTQKLLSH